MMGFLRDVKGFLLKVRCEDQRAVGEIEFARPDRELVGKV